MHVTLCIGEIINSDIFIQGTPTQTLQQGINISAYTASLNQVHVLIYRWYMHVHYSYHVTLCDKQAMCINMNSICMYTS